MRDSQAELGKSHALEQNSDLITYQQGIFDILYHLLT